MACTLLKKLPKFLNFAEFFSKSKYMKSAVRNFVQSKHDKKCENECHDVVVIFAAMLWCCYVVKMITCCFF